MCELESAFFKKFMLDKTSFSGREGEEAGCGFWLESGGMKRTSLVGGIAVRGDIGAERGEEGDGGADARDVCDSAACGCYAGEAGLLLGGIG